MKLLKIVLFIFLLSTQLFIINADIINWNYKGASITGYYYLAFNNIYVYRTIDYLKSLGINSIAIVFSWYQDDYNSTEIYGDNEATLNDNDLIKVIQYCHKQGLKVNLKPHLDLYPTDGKYTKWRALIQPANVKLWFNSFEKFILHYLEIAIDYDIELFTIGTEMISMTRPKYLKYWKNLIKQLRETTYKGQITYCADQAETFGSKALSKSFWDLFDVISISTYFSSEIAWGTNPNYDLLAQEWLNWASRLKVWKNGLKSDKKVIIGEIGFRSIDYTHKSPYQTDGEIKNGCNNFNEKLQADCYNAMLNALDKINWLDGIFIWQEVMTSPPQYFNEHNLDYSIINKLSSNIIIQYFGNTNQPYAKLRKDKYEITGNWYYYNDNDLGGTSKIIIEDNETLDFKFIIKEINGNIKQVSRLSGIITDDYPRGFIGMGINISAGSKQAIKMAIGVKFKVISNIREFDCKIVTSNITDNAFYKATVKVQQNIPVEVIVLFQDLTQYEFGSKKPFMKDKIEGISFQTLNQPVADALIEIYDIVILE